MKIYNEFGIKPTNSFTSAGSDYYVPNIKDESRKQLALKAFEKSYNKTSEEIQIIYKIIEDNYPKYKTNIVNLIHLFLALYDPSLERIKQTDIVKAIAHFINCFVVYDKNKDVVGVKVNLNNTLFINSGIKVALDTVLSDQIGPKQMDGVNLLKLLGIGVCGLYVNKSGKGNAGWDVRACLVDEDYSGFVHLSQAYTKDIISTGQNVVYCGDKLTQMMLLPVFHTEYTEIDENTYNSIMSNSARGDSGFGSQDVKH